ncbi:MAG: hypothetical protein QOH93_2134 [Chloroflexia bacterium]|jgi:hypothetical protein|nr:hypothetical protein [Chloroflexia bacterium]
MISTTHLDDREELYDSAGEPIAYSKDNPPYGKTPLPAHHAQNMATEAEPVVQMVWVPARTQGKTGPQEHRDER